VTFDDFRDYLGDFAWFWPGVAITIVLGFMLAPVVARALKVRWAVAMALIFGLGLIAAATLTPSREALRFGAVGSGSCDLGRIGIASIVEILGFQDPTFNVLLYIPLGVAIGLVPTSRRLVGLIVAAIALPFAIETIQMVVISLDRACQSADISDNLTGLVIGLAIGVVVRWLVGPPGVADDRLPGR
jgi:hypothetical protein